MVSPLSVTPFPDLGLDFSKQVEKSDNYLNNPKEELVFTFVTGIFSNDSLPFCDGV